MKWENKGSFSRPTWPGGGGPRDGGRVGPSTFDPPMHRTGYAITLPCQSSRRRRTGFHSMGGGGWGGGTREVVFGDRIPALQKPSRGVRMRRIAARAVNLGEGDEGKWLPVRKVAGRVPRTQPGKKGARSARSRAMEPTMGILPPLADPSRVRRLSELNHIKHG